MRQLPAAKANGVTMQEIAERAGVSAMTVSRALRDPDSVSGAALERVRTAIRETGYVANRLAGSLSSRRSNVIGLILPGINDSLYAGTVKAISDVLRGRGFHLMITDTGLLPNAEEEAVAAFLGQRVCGLILYNTKHTSRTEALIRSAGIPTIEVGNLLKRPLDSCVSYSSFAAAKAMTVHLGRLGYRRIGFVSLPRQDNDRAAERTLGYFAGLKELGLPEDPAIAMETQSGFAGGAHAVVRLLEIDPAIDAIFFAADVMAVGALFECQRRGWNVPERVAIASFDNVDLLRHVVPSITTLRIPREEIGKRSAELLLDRLNGQAGLPSIVDLGFEVIQRDST
ncbi:MAG TPA: LacI family DNA-binding transcriptional regulator [Rhodopila sp.]